MVRDLFGQVPIALREIELWVFKVPRMAHYERRAAYIHNWRVVEKIEAAKLGGRLHEAIPDEDCEFCGQRLALDMMPAAPAAMNEELRLLRRRVEVLEFLLTAPADWRAKPASASSRRPAPARGRSA